MGKQLTKLKFELFADFPKNLLAKNFDFLERLRKFLSDFK